MAGSIKVKAKPTEEPGPSIENLKVDQLTVIKIILEDGEEQARDDIGDEIVDSILADPDARFFMDQKRRNSL
ncbi:MAG: hypothetical protein ACR2RE_09810, partial [Geminicoccaceae bacterium]